MKALGSSSHPILHSVGWRFFSLLIICVTVPFLLSMMLSSSRGDIEMLDRPQQTRLTFQHRPDEEDENEGFERSIIVDIRTIHSEVKELSDNNRPLSSVNCNPVPGVLSFHKPANSSKRWMPLDDLNATKDFTLSKVGEGAHYGLYK